MKSKFIRLLLVTMALSAFVGVASASATTPQWYVGGKALSGTTALSETVNVVEPIAISVPAGGFKFKCSKATASKGEILAPGTIKLTLTYGGCETTLPATGCDIEERMRGFPIEGTLSKGTGSEDAVLFNGSGTSKRLWEAAWGDEVSCGFGNSVQYLMGTVTLSLPTGQTEAVEQKFSFLGEKESPKGMIFGTGLGNPATMTGKIGLKLKSGLAWAYR